MTEITDRLKTALADRYAIEREIGAGGMATVYIAEDLKHHRKVAVKVLRPELAAVLGPERFLREIETTANLNHPHILPLFDSGEADGFLYYVMPFVEGESLRQRLDREKQLPIEDALKIAQEVGDALSFAHTRDVIHRDIKPENILFEGGHAVVADFGIARAVTAAGGERLTETGTAIGTPVYMSPEQAAGSQDLDGRSDLYSLGCVLYEMLAGQAPFTGPTVESVIKQHLTAEPPNVTAIRPAVPADIVGVLARALAKTPADRFSPVGVFVEALAKRESAVVATPAPAAVGKPRSGLKRAVLIGAGIVVGVGAADMVRRSVTSGPAESDAPKLIVLPFENLGAPEDEYFANGITEEITSRIANFSGLLVRSRQTAVQYKDSEKTLQQIGGELGVDYVLEGTIRTDRRTDGSGQVRITSQLIRVADDAHLWADSYTADLVPGEIFQVQAEVAARVAEVLEVMLLDPEREALAERPTDNLEAYEYYLRGRFQLNKRTGSAIERAVEHFRTSLQLDSGYALAWAGLADGFALLPWYAGWLPDSAFPEAKNTAQRAIAFDSTLVEAHTTLAAVTNWYDWDWAESARLFRRAIEVDPDHANAHHWYGMLLNQLRRFDEGIAALRRARELDPLSLIINTNLGEALYYAGRYEEAIEQYFAVIALDSTFWGAQRALGRAYLKTGRYEQALGAFSRGDAPPELTAVYSALDRGQEALEVLEAQAQRGPRSLLLAYAGLGKLDEAFEQIEIAYQEHSPWLLEEPVMDPYFEILWADPRYDALLSKMGLPR